MTIKKISWRSFVYGCLSFEDVNTPSNKAGIKDDKRQGSFQRMSIVDINNPCSTTLSREISLSLAGSDLHVFTLVDLKTITQSFSLANFLGEGGFGPVHKGFIDRKFRPGLQPQPVAVKLLDREGFQGHREWLTEVIFLGQLKHPNLVKLIGYCCEEEHRLLVYEYMPGGSLENQLFKTFSGSLPWATRMKIAYEAAKGLEFLHGAEKPVIYRDFKASNILLDSDYTAKLSDFGLAKDGPEGDATHVSTRIMGTRGYAAPEYIMTGHLTARSDVYSFGVVLLELMTGRRSVDKTRGSRESNLVEWARPMLTDHRKLERFIDPLLDGQYSENGARKAALLAHQCLSYRPKHRPTMAAVVGILEVIKDYNDIPMGPFVYTVPVETTDSKQTEDKKERGSNDKRVHDAHNRNHYDNQESKFQSRAKCRDDSSGNRRRNLRYGMSSATHNEFSGERY